MSRKPSVWFRQQDGWYYTTLKGKQIKLSQTAAEAEREFRALLSTRSEEPKNVSRVSPRKLADEFFVWCASNVGKDAFRGRSSLCAIMSAPSRRAS